MARLMRMTDFSPGQHRWQLDGIGIRHARIDQQGRYDMRYLLISMALLLCLLGWMVYRSAMDAGEKAMRWDEVIHASH
jgi:hypothetical protein